MGLDIYLYTREQAEQNALNHAAWDAYYDLGDDVPEDAKAAAKAKAEAAPGYSHQIDVPSEKHPKHLFNRRYLRSSYNDGGFNRRVPFLIGSPDEGDLYWIFRPLVGESQEPDPGMLSEAEIPALEQCRARALGVAERLRASDRLAVLKVSPNQFSREWLDIDSDKALGLYRNAVAAERIRDDGWWSNRDMEVFGKGVTILAAVPGSERSFLRDEPWPAVHLVYRMADEAFESYLASAEIVAEFCDEAIALIRQDGGVSMSWSG